MTRLMGLSIVLLVLAGCGADGEPVRPTAGANVSLGTDGVSTSATVGVVKGPIRIGIHL
ncbi:hypothetical protein KO498_17350 [Lentibacter algarum]|uniref:hypothetical protein n=1 Tax=Lentibacter algarum TaxID=576131 RepID=UPI001C080539|nr:hypothetical protein [Lentibacter algarum]MBU2983577.1 hypothetical protein [Lentibacter algarum]